MKSNFKKFFINPVYGTVLGKPMDIPGIWNEEEKMWYIGFYTFWFITIKVYKLHLSKTKYEIEWK